MRLNGEKVLKKSAKVNESDVLDLTSSRDKNSNLLVKRVIIYKVLKSMTKSNKKKLALVTWSNPIAINESTNKPISNWKNNITE